MRRRFMSDTGFKESFDYNNYMTIEALEDDTAVSFVSDIEYGIDGQGWRRLPYGSKVIVNAGQFLSFKGEFTPSTSNIPYYGIGTFTISKNCNLVGNCMSMLFGDNAANNYSLSGKDNAFYKLFYNCTNIVNVSSNFLPATTLAHDCYYSMFNGCSSLTTAPELPATILTDYCYGHMFYNCTNLTTAPALPATTLAHGCYASMFYNCSNLTTAPELPATILTDYCYGHMFQNCTNLTTAPSLPATTLAAMSCYASMFYNCSNLTTAPELSATTLEYRCYNGMFNNCTKLNYIKMLATDISANNCLTDWVYGVASTGTFVKNPAMTSLPTGASGIPGGWAVQNATS